jgi:Holliday junction resolvase-like predicted endonuclease
MASTEEKGQWVMMNHDGRQAVGEIQLIAASASIVVFFVQHP